MIQIRLFSIIVGVLILLFVGYTYYLSNKVGRLETKAANLSTQLEQAKDNINILNDNLNKVEALQSKQTENRIEKTTETIYIQDQKGKTGDVVKSPTESTIKIDKDFSNITKSIIGASQ